MSPAPVEPAAPVPGLLTTRSWFDVAVARAALRVEPADRVLALCGAGDVGLCLAATGASVDLTDLRHAQLAYAHLAIAAAARLPVASARSLFGLDHFGRRVWFYHFLRPELDEATRCFWDAHEGAIRLGLVDQGSVERRVALLRSRALPLAVRREVVEAVLAAPDLETQRTLYRTRWDTWRWHAALRMALSPVALAGAGIQSPRLAAAEANLAARFAARCHHMFEHTKIAGHANLRWALSGTVAGDPGPAWMQPDAYSGLAAGRVPRRWLHGRLLDALHEPPAGGWTAFFLGDAFEDLAPDAEPAVWDALVRAAAPGARLVSWRLSRPYSRPSSVVGRLRRDDAASARALDAEPVPAWVGVDVEVLP